MLLLQESLEQALPTAIKEETGPCPERISLCRSVGRCRTATSRRRRRSQVSVATLVPGNKVRNSGRRQEPKGQASGGGPRTEKSPSRTAPKYCSFKKNGRVCVDEHKTDKHARRNRVKEETWTRGSHVGAFNREGHTVRDKVCTTQKGGGIKKGASSCRALPFIGERRGRWEECPTPAHTCVRRCP